MARTRCATRRPNEPGPRSLHQTRAPTREKPTVTIFAIWSSILTGVRQHAGGCAKTFLKTGKLRAEAERDAAIVHGAPRTEDFRTQLRQPLLFGRSFFQGQNRLGMVGKLRSCDTTGRCRAVLPGRDQSPAPCRPSPCDARPPRGRPLANAVWRWRRPAVPSGLRGSAAGTPAICATGAGATTDAGDLAGLRTVGSAEQSSKETVLGRGGMRKRA